LTPEALAPEEQVPSSAVSLSVTFWLVQVPGG
jgi:hypothetical protein